MKSTMSSRATILMIDDEPQILADLTGALSGAGYTCQTCQDRATALDLVRRSVPDLIISDINLDGQSGLELCGEIRRTPGCGEVPVLFLSGAQIPDVVRQAHEAGGTYYLRKPFDPDVLTDLVDRALWMPHLVSSRGV
jgi:CheY-like chemotaxis protein